jgi:hypothetical protein
LFTPLLSCDLVFPFLEDGVPSFSWLLASFVRSEIYVALLWDHLSILFRLTKIVGIEKSSVLMKIIGLKSKEELRGMDYHHWFKIVASSDFNYVVRILSGNLFLTFGHQHLSSQLVSQEIYLFYLIHSVR